MTDGSIGRRAALKEETSARSSKRAARQLRGRNTTTSWIRNPIAGPEVMIVRPLPKLIGR